MIGAGKLQIGAGRRIDDEEAAGGFFTRRPQQRRFADLGDLHIGEEAGQRGKLGTGEVAEGIERGNAEPLFERTLAAHGVEMGTRDRRQRGARLGNDAADIRIAGEIVTGQHLAGLDACELAGKVAEADRRRDQLAGRDVDGGQRDRGLGAVLLAARGTAR